MVDAAPRLTMVDHAIHWSPVLLVIDSHVLSLAFAAWACPDGHGNAQQPRQIHQAHRSSITSALASGL